MDSKTLTDIVADKTGRSKTEIQNLIDCLAVEVAETLKEGDSITIPSVGSFEPRKRLERVSVHPTTGKRLLIPPKLSVVFKPSSLLKQKIREIKGL